MAGLIAIVRDFTRKVRNGANVADVQADTGGSYDLTFEDYPPSGDDSPPLPSDSVGGVEVQGTGRVITSGYVDTRNAGIAEGGEVRRYARSSDGTIISSVYQRKDGSVTIENDKGSMSLGAGGAISGKNAQGSFELSDAGAFDVKPTAFSVTIGGGSISMDASGALVLNNVQIPINGDLTSPGTITGLVDVIAGTISGKLHLTTGVTAGSDQSGPPV